MDADWLISFKVCGLCSDINYNRSITYKSYSSSNSFSLENINI
jgi:hypothetical protein